MNPDKRWPYNVPRPGRGQVKACPHCGRVAVFSCYHADTGSVTTVVMNAAKAAHLRCVSGKYDPMLFKCEKCGYEGPFENGMTIGDMALCAQCSGKSDRQVKIARRQVAVNES